MEVIPALLEESAESAHKKLKEHGSIAPVFQIDILDGSLFERSSWHDPYELNLPEEELPYFELHLMTLQPMKHIEAWHTAYPKKLKRVLFHTELSAEELERCISEAQGLQLEIGLALSPEADLAPVLTHAGQLERVLVLGVHPGASGQSFLGARVLERIESLRAEFADLTVAVDGGVNAKTAKNIIAAGAHSICAASAIWTDNTTESIKTLTEVALAAGE
jgi:ribulose-phosphate 3-epimerase